MGDIKINLDKPRYDQERYSGRAMHFFQTTNPLNILVSSAKLEEARSLVKKYRGAPKGTTEEDLWRAKVIYDSAFHPDTGEKMNVIGRMSAQVPCNMAIVGGMLTFYKSTSAAIFWQWFNQSFNALVNYTNRSGDSAISEKQLLTSYVLATTGAVTTALLFNKVFAKAPPLIGRFVPILAVAAANCINIPLMRIQELKEGTPVFDSNNNRLGYSKTAAQSGIAQVIFSRIAMGCPGMIFSPIVINYLEKNGTLRCYPSINLPLQICIVGFCLTFATPLACAFFRQQAIISYNRLEPDIKANIDKKYGTNPPQYFYYNKGL